MNKHSCPWCEFRTDDAKALVQHLAMTPTAHAVLATEFEPDQREVLYIKREIAERWEN